MSFEMTWQCGECQNLFYGIKMYANLNDEHAKDLGNWLYKHSHCEQQYDRDYVIYRHPEGTKEWIDAPLDKQELLEREAAL